MRVFIDTSSLFKRYVDEAGSDGFQRLMNQASEVVVSPLTWIEMNAAIERRIRDGSLSAEQAKHVRIEAKRDFAYFLKVIWSENLENKAVELIGQYVLKTLDAVQLASGILSKSQVFVTSDEKLFFTAKKIIRHARII